VNSGTSALHLSLLAKGIKPGDEIITVPNSFISTTWAITYCGANPIFVDVDPKTWLIDTDMIEEKITKKTKAILPVHLYGQPCQMDLINNIAKKHNIAVVEDAAQAHAAKYKNNKIGSLGNTTCFSFYPGKNLGAYGEGGAILTNDKFEASLLSKLRNHGQSKRYYHDIVGYNYRMDGLQGAILNVKLKHIQKWTDERNRIASIYSNKLGLIKEVQVPLIEKNNISAFHLYVIKAKNRDKLISFLSEKGIDTGLHYPVPIHLQDSYKYLGHKLGSFPTSELNASECLSLPLFPELTDEQIKFVYKSITEFYKN